MTAGIRRSISAPILQGSTGQQAGPDRESALDELLSSERIYVRSLAAIRDIFHTPLLIRSLNVEHQLMSASDITAVFRNIREIAALHQRLLERIEEKAKRWSAGQALGESLLEWAQGAPAAYIEYCTGQERGLTLLARCSASETRLRMFLAHAVSHPQCQGDSLRHLLSLPLQRLSRYIQILPRFVSATPVEHPDHVEIQYVLDIWEKTIDKVAEKMLAASASEQWVSLRRQLSGPLVDRLSRMVLCMEDFDRRPFNWLIMQGKLQRTGNDAQRHLFLFRNSLALCTGDFHQGFSLDQVMAVDRLTSLEPNAPGDDPNTISIYRIDSDVHLRVVFTSNFAISAELLFTENEYPDNLDRWLHAFKLCIAGTNEELVQIGAMCCRCCNAFFTLDMRRILCEHCTYFYCSNCIRPYADSAEELINICPICVTESMNMHYFDWHLSSNEAEKDHEIESGSGSEGKRSKITNEEHNDRSDNILEPDSSSESVALDLPPNADTQYEQFLVEESRFVSELSTLISLYVNPLITMSCVPKLRLLSRDDLHVVFGQTLALLMSHTHLEKELKKSPVTSVEQVFARNLSFLQTYTGSLFVSNIGRSLNRVQNEMEKMPKLRRFFAACLEQITDTWRRSLIDLLELPAQRLPAYISLLPNGSPTRSTMVSVLTSLISSLEAADVCRRTAMARSQIEKLDGKVDWGKFVRKGPLLKQGDVEPMTCFLFEKMFLMCKLSKSGSSHVVKKRMVIGQDLVFVNDFVSSAAASTPRYSIKPTPLQIVLRRKSMIVHARDERDRIHWVLALRISIGSARFEDSTATSTCHCCSGFFTLALRRRLCYGCCEFSCPGCIIIQPESMQSVCIECNALLNNKVNRFK